MDASKLVEFGLKNTIDFVAKASSHWRESASHQVINFESGYKGVEGKQDHILTQVII